MAKTQETFWDPDYEFDAPMWYDFTTDCYDDRFNDDWFERQLEKLNKNVESRYQPKLDTTKPTYPPKLRLYPHKPSIITNTLENSTATSNLPGPTKILENSIATSNLPGPTKILENSTATCNPPSTSRKLENSIATSNPPGTTRKLENSTSTYNPPGTTRKLLTRMNTVPPRRVLKEEEPKVAVKMPYEETHRVPLQTIKSNTQTQPRRPPQPLVSSNTCNTTATRVPGTNQKGKGNEKKDTSPNKKPHLTIPITPEFVRREERKKTERIRQQQQQQQQKVTNPVTNTAKDRNNPRPPWR